MNILLTGHTSGVGKSLLLSLNDGKNKIVCISRTKCDFDIDKSNIKEITFDMGCLENSDEVIEELGEVEFDLIINNAGATLREYIEGHSFKDIHKIMNVNCIFPMMLLKKTLIDDKKQTVINVLSGSALEEFRMLSVYSSAKTGLYKFTKQIAKDYESKGIKNKVFLNAFPGPIDTKMCPEHYKNKEGSAMLKPTDVSDRIIDEFYKNKSNYGTTKSIFFKTKPEKKMSKTYVITGCTKTNSLGYAIAEQIKKSDENSVIVAVGEYGIDCSVESSLDENPNIDFVYYCDFTKDCSETISTIKENFKEIYCLINCAAINGNVPFQSITEEFLDKTLDVNVKSIFKMSQGLLENISAAGGTILNVASNCGLRAMTGLFAYNTSKAAVLMLTRQMARELTKKNNITVFSISPCKIEGTRMSNQIDNETVELNGITMDQCLKYGVDGLVAGQEVKLERISEFVAFILSTKERHIHFSGCDIPYGI